MDVDAVNSLSSGKGNGSSSPRDGCFKCGGAHFQRNCNARKGTGKQSHGKGKQSKSWSKSEPSHSGKGNSKKNKSKSTGKSTGKSNAVILAFPVKVLSMIVQILSRHLSLCGFVAFPCDASAAQPGQPPVCPCASMSADKTQSLLGSTSGALSTTILGNGGPAPSLSAVTFFVNFNSGATICHGVEHRPSQFVDSQASLSVCLVQLLPRTTHSWSCTKLLLIDHDDQRRFLESCGLEKN